MVRFAQKLKALKKAFKVWNMNFFGNINQAVKRAEDEILIIEM